MSTATAETARPGNRYSYIHAAVSQNPAPIEKQIKRAVSEIERFSRHRQRMIDSGKWAPATGADTLYELRSILITLQAVQAGGNVEASHADV